MGCNVLLSSDLDALIFDRPELKLPKAPRPGLYMTTETAMDKETTAAIRKIIDYIENAERKNFEDAEPEDRAEHICNSVQLVRKRLDIKQWLESPSLTTIDPSMATRVLPNPDNSCAHDTSMATALMKELKDATVDCEE